jgi:hypothetical protein
MGNYDWKRDINFRAPPAKAAEQAAYGMREAIGVENPECQKCIFWTELMARWCRKHQYIEDAPNIRSFSESPNAETVCDDYVYYPAHSKEDE